MRAGSRGVESSTGKKGEGEGGRGEKGGNPPGVKTAASLAHLQGARMKEKEGRAESASPGSPGRASASTSVQASCGGARIGKHWSVLASSGEGVHPQALGVQASSGRGRLG